MAHSHETSSQHDRIARISKQYGYNYGCIVPGCDRRPILHHIVPKRAGGSNAMSNLMPICKYHEEPLHTAGAVALRDYLHKKKPTPIQTIPRRFSVMTWTSLDTLSPEDGSEVIVGHSLGKWVITDVLFKDGMFLIRVNAQTGGTAGYKQKDTTKPNGDPAGPDEWLWGPRCHPTHWMYPPKPPIE